MPTPHLVLQVKIYRVVRPVQGEHHQAGHDRRQRERQIYHRIDEALAGKVVAGEHPGHQGQPEDEVHEGNAKRSASPERLQRDATQNACQPPPAACHTIAASGGAR